MKNVLTVNLDNEMDLILAHKRAMKLAELCSISLPAQTIFATAVSEIVRVAIERGTAGRITLGIVFLPGNRKQLCALVSAPNAFCSASSESITNARRLVDQVDFAQTPSETQVSIFFHLPYPNLITEAKIQAFVAYFEQELPISPYDELRRKNVQLQELAYRLRESENNYRQLTDSLPLMMFSLNQSGRVTYVNKWLKDFLGFKANQLQSALFQPFIHPEEYDGIYTDWLKAQENVTLLRGQARLRHVDTGEYIWHMLSIIPLRTGADNEVVWNGFLVDIHAQKMIEQTLQDNTQLKEIQHQLRENQAVLENKIVELNRSNHDLEQFAYIASHDLQEPLRKIRIFADLLQSSAHDPAAVNTYYNRIDRAAERMAVLIKGVLAYSRISDSRDEEFEIVDLNTVMDQVEADFDNRIRQKGAIIERQLLPVLPGIPLQMQQLFANLLSNALKFSERQPVIRIAARPLSAEIKSAFSSLRAEKDYVEITFEDEGIGFEPEYGEKIFTIFQQLNNRSAYEGTGIGLALCKKVVERHHGIIYATSRFREGSTFHVILPNLEEG